MLIEEPMTTEVLNQIKAAHKAMGGSADDAESYARCWWREEDDRQFAIGCCNFETRKATIFAIEAARNMCAGILGDADALRLLKMAVKEMERIVKEAA